MAKLKVREGLKKGGRKKKEEKVESTIKDVFSDWKEEKTFFEEDEIETKKKTYLTDILNDIKFNKTGKVLDIEEAEKQFNSWLILRFLSMDEDLTEIVALVNEYQSVLSKKEFYKLLVEVIPKTKRFAQYIKGNEVKKDERIQKISRYYECSHRHAREYINIMGDQWADAVVNKFGGKEKK